jgi:hypothetical protein
MTGNLDEAIRWSKQSIEQRADNPGATFILVASYIRGKKNLDEAERMINQLEAQGIDKEMITQARQELASARSGKAPTSGVDSGSKTSTSLQHGPEESKPNQK